MQVKRWRNRISHVGLLLKMCIKTELKGLQDTKVVVDLMASTHLSEVRTQMKALRTVPLHYGSEDVFLFILIILTAGRLSLTLRMRVHAVRFSQFTNLT